MNLEQVPNAGDHIALPQELIECAAGFSAVNDQNPGVNILLKIENYSEIRNKR